MPPESTMQEANAPSGELTVLEWVGYEIPECGRRLLFWRLGPRLPVQYIVPAEGSQIWEDDWAIAAEAQHPDLAH